MNFFSVMFVACVLLAAGPVLAADGASLYAENCASCHGPDAKAATPVAAAMKVPAVAGHDAADVAASVKTNPKHTVPAGKLSDEDLQAIGAYLEAL